MEILIRHRRFWLLPVLIWTAVLLASYTWNVGEAERHVRELALAQGRLVFKIIESMRLWNARHGGVYAPVAPHTPPNEYLEGLPERDVTTTNGRQLTLVNPAYMTRQVADAMLEHYDIRVHLTSLKPLNPGNRADDWETRSLQSFEAGAAEQMEFADPSRPERVRFIAPLRTRLECLKCHEKQGYKVGDIRGGISVSFSAAQLFSSQEGQRRQLLAIHAAVWAILVALTLFALTRFRRQLGSLQDAKAAQESVVQQRTAELRAQINERIQAEARLRLLVNSSGDGLYGIDIDGLCTFINPMALRLLGLRSAEQVLGQPMHPIVHGCRADAPCRRGMPCKLDSFLDGMPIHEEDVFCRADGSTLPVEYRARPIIVDGQVLGAVVSFADITRRKQSEALIWRQANYDPLTDLPNRSLFNDRFRQAVAQAARGGAGLALLFVDLDGFKSVNDEFGHDAGDELLRQVARRLAACVRDSDTVARLGGDEFTIVLSQIVTRADAEAVAAKIRDGFAIPFDLEGRCTVIGASIGVACYPADGQDAASLLKRADAAMYRAKAAKVDTGGPPEN